MTDTYLLLILIAIWVHAVVSILDHRELIKLLDALATMIGEALDGRNPR